MPRTRSLAWSELKIGVMAVASIALTALLVIAVGGETGFAWQRYTLKTTFANVQGLKSGAIVRVAGVEVGKVTRVALAGTGVEVDLSVKNENKPRITTDSRASIGSLSLLGEPLIDSVAVDDRHAAQGRRPIQPRSRRGAAVGRGRYAPMRGSKKRRRCSRTFAAAKARSASCSPTRSCTGSSMPLSRRPTRSPTRSTRGRERSASCPTIRRPTTSCRRRWPISTT